MRLVVFDYLERDATPNLNDTAFLQALRYYGAVNAETLARNVGHLSGERQGMWTLSDVASNQDNPGGSIDPMNATLAERIHLLGLEFIGYLPRHLDMPFTKANLEVSELCDYLDEPDSGALQRRSDALASGHRRKTNKPTKKKQRSPNPLCPDPASLRDFLNYAEGVLMSRQYPLGALLELIPAWMDYLLSRGLCDIVTRGGYRQDQTGLPGVDGTI